MMKKRLFYLLALMLTMLTQGVWAQGGLEGGLPTDKDGAYLINNAAEWNTFCVTVNNNILNYNGKTVKLTYDISGVTQMVGTEEHPFSGTFDGQEHTLTVDFRSSGTAALFGKVNNATIRNLHVAGSVQTTMNSGADHSAGLVGKAAGSVNIQNVRVSATVTGFNYYGGFVGHGGGGTIWMTGCVFDGQLTENAAGSTQHAGGFIGWGDNMNFEMTDCLFAGTCTIGTDGSAAHNFHPVGYYSSYGNVTVTPKLTRVYYLQAASHNRNENSGKVLSNGEKQAYTISTTDANVTTFAVSGNGTRYSVSGITSYAPGFMYGSTLYAGSGESVNLTLAHTATTEGHWFLGYGVTGGGSLDDETSDTPTLTMTDADQTISAIYANKTIPYSYGFENINTEAEGWTKTNCDGSTVIMDKKQENPYSGNYLFRFYNNSNPPQYFISPALYIPANATNIKLSFYHKSDSYDDDSDPETFKVGYSTTTNDPSSFVWQNEVSVNNTNWSHYESDAFPVHPRYVAIAYSTPYDSWGNIPYLCIDDISIASDYDEAAMIVTDGSTRIFSGYNYGFGLKSPGTTKTFTLSNPGTADAPVSVTHTGNFGVALSATSIPAGGNITLTVTLPTVVEGDDAITISSTSENISDFVINVSGVAKVPGKLDESLDGNATPYGWRTTGDNWHWGGGVYNDAWKAAANNRLITPKVTVSEGEIFSFDAMGYSYNNPQGGGVILEYSTDGENWNASETAIPLKNYWQTYTVSDIPAGEYYIALHAWYVTLRNYYGGTLPALPMQLTATGITSSEATIGWVPYTDETAWQVSYSTTQGAPAGGTLVNANSTSTTITGLTPQTTYYVSARIDYGNGSYGNWSEEFSFSTTMVAVSADAGYSENFEGANNWLLINGDVDNAWAIGSATNHGGSKSLYISNDGGTTYAYDNTKRSTVYAAKLFTFEGGDYSFAYDWKCQGIENGDYLRVFLVPVTETLTASAEWTQSFNRPDSWIAIEGGSSKSGKDKWQNELYCVEVPAGSYYVVFQWSNAGFDMGVNPPAAIDNFAIYTDVEVATTYADGADNSDAIAADAVNCTAYNLIYNVTLSGRTLYKDGKWNTLTLPFAVSDFAGTPLEGATVKELLTTSNLNNGTLTLNFSDNLTAIEAGKPYIVKWASGSDIVSPVFTGVTIDDTNRDVYFTGGTFKGNYSPLEITDANRDDIVLLAAGNKLGYAKTDRTIANGKALGACHAYFNIPSNGGQAARRFVLNFGDDEGTTGIIEMEDVRGQKDDVNGVFDLQGRRVENPAKGLYVVNGKKIIIK